MSDIFISYSRKDIAYARLLHKALKENDLETWIDWQDIPPSTEWLNEIFTAIEQANTFIFILSSTSALSDICTQEIEHARKNNKRIIPIVIDDVDPSKVHSALAAINWIFSRSKDELQPAIANLIAAIQTDYEWVKVHTRLQMRALEWERADQDKSFLLQGTDLQQAEDWLAKAPEKEPEPTLIQTRYIQSSRQGAVKRHRNLLVGVGAALVVTIVLGIFAVINGQRAEQQRGIAEENALGLATQVVIAEEQTGIAIEQARLAHIRELTAISQQNGIRFDIAILLGVEAFNSIDNYQTRSNLLKLAQLNPKVERIMHHKANSISFSPDGKTLASGGRDSNTILLWDTISGQLTGSPLHGHVEQIRTLAFSPDGKILVSGGDDGNIILWDIAIRQPIGDPVKVHTDWINGIAFSPDGKTLALGCENSTIALWDMINMQMIGKEIFPNIGTLTSIAFSPDGKTVAFGGQDQTIRLWDVTTMQLIGEPLRGHHMTILTIAFSPDGKTLVSAGEDRTIILWDVESMQPIGEPLKGHSSGISTVAFSPDGKTLASGSWDRTITLWDIESGQPIGEPLLVHTNRISDVIFSPDGKTLASASEDGTILFWNLNGNEQIVDQPLGHQTYEFHGGTLSSNGKVLAWVDEKGNVTLNDVVTGQPIGTPLESVVYPPLRLTFNADASSLASVIEDGSIILWETASGRRTFVPPSGYSVGDFVIALSPSGKLLATSCNNQQGNTITLWDFTNGQPVSETLKPNIRNLTSLVFSPDERILVVGHDEGLILWDVTSRQRFGETLKGHTDWITSIAFSPDGKVLASGGGGTIILWDTTSWEPISEPLPAFSDHIAHIVITPDGKNMVSVGVEGLFVLWDLTAQQPIGSPFRLRTSPVPVLSVVFSEDGKFLVSLNEDGSIASWETTPNSWRVQLCERAGRNFTQEEWAFYFPGEPYRKTCEQWPEGM